MERDDALALLLRQAERRVTARLGALLVDRGSSVEQWRVLACLADGAGRAMGEVGADIGMPAPTLSKLVDTMVSDNLLHRRPDPQDRRRILVHLTERGRRVHGELAAPVAQERAALDALVGAAELDALVGQLASLLRSLDRVEAGDGVPAGR